MSKYSKPGQVLFKLNGSWISNSHTVCAYAAFFAALACGLVLHFHKIVQNEFFGYPQEWFPSVSATIGDRYPERSVFQLLIALTAGPRFLLVGLFYLLTATPSSVLPKIMLGSGLLRTFTCGGWVYITSTDDHDWHDIFMISYIVLTLPWDIIGIILSKPHSKGLKYRKIYTFLFFGTIVPLVYFFIQHKVHHIPGAYTIYAFFEWTLVLLDVAYDSATLYDFSALEFRVIDIKGVTDAAQYAPVSKSGSYTKKVQGLSYFSFISTVLNSFIFWSVLTSLPLLIWYFPLWYMGISGYEAFLFAIISPLILAIPFVRSIFTTIPQLASLGTVLGVCAFWVLKPEDRLAAVGLGSFFGFIAIALVFWGVSTKPLVGLHRASAFSIGLLLSSVAKYAFYTNNPIWPIMHEANGGLNLIGVIVGALAALCFTRPQAPKTGKQPASIATSKESGIAAGFGFAGLICSLHTLLSDSTTIMLWGWEGYPVRGPLPVPHGLITFAVMAFGIYIGITRRTSTGSWPAFMLGSAGAFVMYTCTGWVGYIGGMILAGYLMSIVPVILESAGRHNPAKSFGVGAVVLVFLYLAHVWIVAYAFVPGGPLLRERSDIVLIAQQVCIALGIYSHNRIKVSPNSAATANGSNGVAAVKKIASQAFITLTVVLALASALTFKRFNRDLPKPHHPEEKLMTAGIWTIHFGLDNDMWASEGRMRDLLADAELDVVGFLESDTQRVIMGHRDITQQIAEELGYYTDFGPGPNKHTWGCALFSKFPILNSTHHLLPSPVGELAPAIHATLDVYGKAVDVVVFHSGQEEDVEDRRLQSLGISDIMAGSSNPLILLSYLVTKPLQGNYHTYVSEYNGMNDIDPSDWDRWCEYILYKGPGIKRTGYARISRSTITDTELQVGKFVIGEEPNTSNKQIPESQVPVGRRFPEKFRGEGVRGHRFHVFDEPRYYE